jgi:hypothetical protein
MPQLADCVVGPGGLSQSGNLNSLQWQTSLNASIDTQSIFPALANLFLVGLGVYLTIGIVFATVATRDDYPWGGKD